MKSIRKEHQHNQSPIHTCYNPLPNLLAQYAPIPAEARHFIEQHSYHLQVSGHHTLLEAGQTAKSIYLVQTGVLRLHKQHTNRISSGALFFPGALAPNPIDFFFELPAQSDLVTVIPSILYAMDLPHVRSLVKYYPQVSESLTPLLRQSRQGITEKHQWEHLSTREKIQHFLEKHPDAANQIPFKIIASYLGIKAETLSRHLSALYVSKKTRSGH